MARQNWFRHDNDAHHNPKLRRLPEPTQLFFWWLCELKSRDQYDGASDEEIAWLLHVETDRVTREKRYMKRAGLLNQDGSIKGWEERQPATQNTSTERVRRHRAKKKSGETGETLHETFHERFMFDI